MPVLGCTDAIHRLSPPLDVTVLARPSAMSVSRSRARMAWLDVDDDDTGQTVRRGTAPFAAVAHPGDDRSASGGVLQSVLHARHHLVGRGVSTARRLDGTWSFLADHADGFLFDSAFTERRFLARFGQAADTPRAVCHYPFNPAEYLDNRAQRAKTSDFILVIGNELDHKDAVRTIELLSSAFPFRPLVSLGPKLTETPYLRAYRSGSLSEADVSRLYAEARVRGVPVVLRGLCVPDRHGAGPWQDDHRATVGAAR